MGDVEVTEQDGIAIVTIDDGKVNALSRELIAEASEAISGLDEAPFVLTGNAKTMSAGLDRTIFAEGREGVIDLMSRFGSLIRQVFLHPAPVVVAAQGHAIAGGAFLAMAGDWTIAANDDGNWGFIETAIGMTLPSFAFAMATHRVRADLRDRLVLSGRTLNPREALEVGLVDELAEPVELLPRALQKTSELSQLARRSYAATKHRLRAHLVETDEDAARADLEDYFDSSPIFDDVSA